MKERPLRRSICFHFGHKIEIFEIWREHLDPFLLSLMSQRLLNAKLIDLIFHEAEVSAR